MVSVVQYLTNRIEDSFSLRDGNDNYLLHYACRSGNIEVVRYLLESGHTRAVNAKNKDNMLTVHLFNQFVKERWREGNDMKHAHECIVSEVTRKTKLCTPYNANYLCTQLSTNTKELSWDQSVN
eukprot:scaffold642_cov75-Cyclotella_meneghiniana.AAC.13